MSAAKPGKHEGLTSVNAVAEANMLLTKYSAYKKNWNANFQFDGVENVNVVKTRNFFICGEVPLGYYLFPNP